ncbi:MAG: hypothetical protein PHO08_00280 [Methylococcales bacterium]|nr:hypothetical protein [Methylococcales bacterium]MDD5631266.1 hypothetical protein [Methylococcales bacterium]
MQHTLAWNLAIVVYCNPNGRLMLARLIDGEVTDHGYIGTFN